MYFYFYDNFVSEKKYENLLNKIENRLIELGINGRIEKLTVLKNMKELIEDGIKKGAHTVVAVGDDRTLIKTINIVAHHKDVLIGFIPIKENSVFTQILGIENTINACNIIAKRLAKIIDLGRVNQNFFVGSIEIPNAKNVKIECDGKFKVSSTNPEFSLSIKNLGHLFDRRTFQKFNARDSLLDVVIAPPNYSGLKKIVNKKIEEDRTIFRAKKIRIASEDESVPVILDDEITLKTPLSITVKPKKVKLIIGRSRLL